jgi:hypothetical protein
VWAAISSGLAKRALKCLKAYNLSRSFHQGCLIQIFFVYCAVEDDLSLPKRFQLLLNPNTG